MHKSVRQIQVSETTSFSLSKMADGTIDCDFPVWGLLPKKETGVVSFLNKNPTYDGRGTIIAIFDSGVDPAAAGLQLTSTGETKVIERFDCSGCGDVDTSTVVTKIVDGCIAGLTGRKLKIPETWQNPSGEWRVGVLYPFSLYPGKLKERVQDHRREHRWDVGHKPAFAKANAELLEFESQHSPNSTLSPEDKLKKEELEARVEVLQNAEKKYTDLGPAYDCVLFHDGTVWHACIDTSEVGDLASGPCLREFSATKDHRHLTTLDEMTISINVHGNGQVLEVVGMCSTHGTHVAAIAAGYFPDEPEKNGVAPGAKIISLTIGDSRLGSMETGTALVRACIKIMELSKTMKIDVINMSYGEHAHWSNSGRVGELINMVVSRYRVTWVVSAGNHGPALGTVGAPPDIAHPVLIGVGAYVSPEMMSSAYSMRARAGGGAFSWSSRGPAGDGARGVALCAPGGAVAAVARFTLRNCQLMNGTSMAAPHVAGAVGILISGLKALNLPYSPYSLKRALENSAAYLSHVEPWAQGCGLLDVEKAFDLLTTYHDAPDRDVTFNIQCGPTHAKGILLRPKVDEAPRDIGITVEPQFLQDHEDAEDTSSLKQQIAFNLRLALTCAAPWVSAPAHLDLSNVSRPLCARVDTRRLPPGPHYASIDAYDVSRPRAGPVFRVPLTVLQPHPPPPSPAAPALQHTAVVFQPSSIVRHILIPPAGATWAVLRITADEPDASGRFLIHTMQLLPHKSCRSHESQKMVTVTSEAPTLLPFQVVAGVTLEVVIAKYWASLGAVTLSYSVQFRGVGCAGGGRRLAFCGAEGVLPLTVAALGAEELQPSAQLKYSEPVHRPTESKISPLSERDVVPPGRQIYQLINSYSFHLPKGTEVSPIVPLLCDMLYESEFESQMWMLYNCCKQLVAVGDAYPSKYSVKLDKGEYSLRLQVRHESRTQLERLQELPLLVQQKLPQPVTLDVYGTLSQAITGGKKFNSTTVSNGTLTPIYITAVPSDKISRSNLTIGQTLTGTMTFAKDELGRKVDTYELQYVVPEPPKRNLPKDKEKPKPNEEYHEALKDFNTTWLAKLEGEELERVYAQTTQLYPTHLGATLAYISALEPPGDYNKLPHADIPPEVTPASCEQIIALADKVIKQIDQDKLLAYLGMKNDPRPDANKIKQEHEKQRGYLIEALCRRGTAMCRLLALGQGDKAAARDNMAELLKFTDLTDTKVMNYGVWHCFSLGQWARAARLLNKMQEERPSREADERLVDVYTKLGWQHLRRHTVAHLPTRYPHAYRPF